MAVICASTATLIVTFLLVSSVNCQRLHLYVAEEEPPNTLVGDVSLSNNGNLMADLNLSGIDISALSYKFFAQGNPRANLFLISADLGIIKTRSRIDREALCPNVNTECLVSLAIAVYSDVLNIIRTFPIAIHVQDVNDNEPTFPQDLVELQIPEITNPDVSFALIAAFDLDSGRNAEIAYDLVPPNEIFGLGVLKNLDGSTTVRLTLKQALNREATAEYRYRLIARDSGDESRSGTADVHIIVTDSNDHPPAFTESIYNATITENIPIGSTVIQLSASDVDLGLNAQVRYRWGSRVTATIKSLFSLNETSGELVVVGGIDYEQGTSHQFVVEARDMGSNPLTAQALVVIRVEDENDNSPEINFNFISNGTFAAIPENASPQRFVAHLSVSDKDSALYSRVSCESNSPGFNIQWLYDTEYQIILDRSLDREANDSYDVIVTCKDNGLPPRITSRSFKVMVDDLNDNSPEFLQANYYVTLFENNQINDVITEVSAKDADIGINGQIIYSLSPEVHHLFQMNSRLGLITARKGLDREAAATIRFQVYATDNNTPYHTATASVIITLLDQNDEHPKFTFTDTVIDIQETIPANSSLGYFNATDPDLGDGGEVIYFLSSGYESFSIDPTTALIKTVTEFEWSWNHQNQFQVTIVARDQGQPSLSTSIIVTINIIDVNDNAPVMTFPNLVNNTVNILNTHKVKTVVAKVNAYDNDGDENARLTYFLIDRYDMFSIRANNGEVILVKSISDINRTESFILNVVVADNGSPSLEANRPLKITITPDNSTALANIQASDVSKRNIIIVVVVIGITLVISSVIVGVILMIRRKDQLKKSQDADNIITGADTQSKENTPTMRKDNSLYPYRSSARKNVTFPIGYSDDKEAVLESDGTIRIIQSTHVKPEDRIITTHPANSLYQSANSSEPQRMSSFSSHDRERDNMQLHQHPPPHVRVDEENHRSVTPPHNLTLSSYIISEDPQLEQQQQQYQHHQHQNHHQQQQQQYQHNPQQYQNYRPWSQQYMKPQRKVDDATSDTSGETIPSDSGRGGSDDDARSRGHNSLDDQGHYV